DHNLRLSARRRLASRSAGCRTNVSRDRAGVPRGTGGVHDEPQAAQLRDRETGDSMRSAALTVELALTLTGCGGSRPQAAGGSPQAAPSAAASTTPAAA